MFFTKQKSVKEKRVFTPCSESGKTVVCLKSPCFIVFYAVLSCVLCSSYFSVVLPCVLCKLCFMSCCHVPLACSVEDWICRKGKGNQLTGDTIK